MIEPGTETKLFSSASTLTPNSRTSTFRRRTDRGYNTLYFASKIVCQMGRVPLWIPPLIFASTDDITHHAVIHHRPENANKHRPHPYIKCRQCLFVFHIHVIFKHIVSVGCCANIFIYGKLPFPICRLFHSYDTFPTHQNLRFQASPCTQMLR